MDRRETVKGSLAIVATSLLWSTGGLFIKLIPWSPLSINAARCIVALIIRTLLRKGRPPKITPITLLGALCFSGTSLFYALANKYTTAGNAILLQYAYPFFLMGLAWIFQKRRPARRDVITSVVIIAGIFLCCYDSIRTGGMLGNLFGILSGVCFSVYFFSNTLEGANPADANYIGFIIGSVVGLPWLVQETVFRLDIAIYILILGAFQLAFAYILFEYGIQRISAISAAFIAALEPIANPILVAIFYGERMGSLAVLGGILVIAAVLVYSIQNARATAHRKIS